MNQIDQNRELIAVLRVDFPAFVEKCFNYLNHGIPYEHNWHVEAIAYQLAECLAGNIKRLVILLPPRHLKSTIVSIAWTAFVLGHFPSKKFICASYSQDLANKLSNDTRSIMSSEWYRSMFPETMISQSKDTQQLFETTQHGGRFATSIGGPLTGFGGDIIVVDDPQKPIDMTHEGSRHKARDWLFNTAISRFNSPKDGILVIVMQRLHEDDLVGNLENQADIKILRIPARAEEPLVYSTSPRTKHIFEQGDYLHESRFGPVQFDAQRRAMGSREFSAQYQQDPLPSDGGLFEWDWFRPCDSVPAISELIMSVDVAATDGGGNYTGVTLWGHLGGNWYLMAVHRYQFNPVKVRQKIKALDQEYRPDLLVIDSGGVGKGVISELRNEGLKHILGSGSSTSKVARANDIAAMIEAGRVFVLTTAPGLYDFRKEIVSFPNGKYDDLVDSMTQILRYGGRAVRHAQLHKRSERQGIKSTRPQTAISIIRISAHRRLGKYS